MKKLVYIFTYIAALIIGVVFLIFNYQTLESAAPMLRGVMIATGVIFIVPGVVLLIESLMPKRDENGNIIKKAWYLTLVSILALVWGILLICMPSGIGGNLSISLGVSIILAGLAQIVWIIKGSESTFTRFIVPALTIVAGVIDLSLLSTPDNGRSAQYASILSGIMIVLWAINGFYSLRSKRVVAAASKAAKAERKLEKEERKEAKAQQKEEKQAAEQAKAAETEKSTITDSPAKSGKSPDADDASAKEVPAEKEVAAEKEEAAEKE